MGDFYFPDTPKTIIDKLGGKDETYSKQLLWTRFFDIYHLPIKAMILASFKSYNWHSVPEDAVENITTDVVVGLMKSFNKAAEGKGGYNAEKTEKFRYFLKSIVNNNVVDFIRKDSRRPKSVSFEPLENFDLRAEALSDIEKENYKYARILEIYEEEVRPAFEPNCILSFEKRHFEGMKPALIANELGITSKQASNYIYRVAKKLRKSVKKGKV